MKPPIASVRTAAAAGVLLLLASGAVAVWRASQALHLAAVDVRSEHEIHFVVRPLPPAVSAFFEVINSPAVFFHAARFQDHLYVAGPAGLLEYEPGGTQLHQYAVGRELPGSPLIALVPYTPWAISLCLNHCVAFDKGQPIYGRQIYDAALNNFARPSISAELVSPITK